MIELARLFTTNGYRPRRSMMFISFGAEEAGIEATESDWLAGSDAFIRQHPEITRRLALGVNIDVTGWGGPRGNYLTTPDGVTFGQALVNDLGEGDKTSVLPIPTSTTDAWNLASVGGGTVAMIQRTNESNGGVFGGGSSFSAIYHTDFDIFDPAHFSNLAADLRIEALSIVRTDQSMALPIDFGALAGWIGTALTADQARVQGIGFDDAQAALAKFRAAWTRVEQARPSLRTKAQAGPVNLWLMRTRKDAMPWLMARGGGGVRTTSFATQAQTLAAARTAAEQGDRVATLQAIERLAGASPRVSREAFADQRLYAYTSGDWSVQFGHRARPLPMSIYDIYQRLKAGGDPKQETAAIGALETEARANLTDALFLITGKLNLAAQALGETPLQAAEKRQPESGIRN